MTYDQGISVATIQRRVELEFSLIPKTSNLQATMRSVFLIKIINKFYEFVLRILSSLWIPNYIDPTRILVAHRTLAQKQAETQLDRIDFSRPAVKTKLLVIVPYRDRWDLTESCLRYLSEQVFDSQLSMHVTLVDNRSCDQVTLASAMTVQTAFPKLNLSQISADYDFNFSRMNNEAFRSTPSDLVLFLNNDVELRDKTILSRMVCSMQQTPNLKAAGCTLLYPDRRIQHLFAAPGVKIIAAHPGKGRFYNPEDAWFQKPARAVAAITGAALLVRSAEFSEVGLFDEQLPTLAQDIDLCLRLTKSESSFCATIHSPNSFHLESPTKTTLFPKREIELFYKKWDRTSFDRLYSKRLSRWSETPVIGLPGEPRFPATSFGDLC